MDMHPVPDAGAPAFSAAVATIAAPWIAVTAAATAINMAAPLMMGGGGRQLAAIRITLAIHLLGGIWLAVAALV